MAKLSGLFTSSAETCDAAIKSSLKTHYYRNDHTKIIECIKDMGRQLKGMKWIHINQKQTEITFEYRNGLFINDIVVTVFRVTPIQHAIDIYSSSRSRLPDFGANEKLISQIYRYLDSQLQMMNR